MDTLEISSVLAGYRIDGVLGEGGMGAVYRATQMSLERVVALKVLTAELSSDPMFRERFRREGLLQATLDHPHIVTVYEAGETADRLFLAMQMIEGPTLKQLISDGSLDDRRAFRLLTQVAGALDSAHARGLIHRDVKPQNVLVGRGDHAYLADFGLTRGSDDLRMTSTGLFVGTIDYISPEQARGEDATARTDVYALAAVLYECLTGSVPFVKTSDDRVLLAHLSEAPPQLSERRADLPSHLGEVIAKGLSKDPSTRQASARDLMSDARRALGTLVSAPDARAGATKVGAALPQGPPGPGPAGGVLEALPAPGALEHTDPGPGRLSTKDTDRQPARGPIDRAEPVWRARHLLFLAAVVIGAAALGVLGGRSGGSGSSASFGRSASVGALELSYPDSWERVTPLRPSSSVSDPLELRPAGSASQGALLAGHASSSGPGLLPSGFSPLSHKAAEAVRLGDLQSYRYEDVSLPGLGGSATVYVVPTTAGVIGIACQANTRGVSSECARIAATLRLTGANPFPLAPSRSYATALSGVLERLHVALTGGTARLSSARGARTQAGAAEQLARALGQAAGSVRVLSVSPAVGSANASLAGALARARVAYLSLARAARKGDEAAYRRAAQQVTEAAGAVAGAYGQLRSAGYTASG